MFARKNLRDKQGKAIFPLRSIKFTFPKSKRVYVKKQLKIMGIYYLGLDIGGTKCAACVGLVENNGIRIVERTETPTVADPLKTLGALDESISQYLRRYRIRRAGISCGGPLDSATGVIVNPPNLVGWENFRITEYIEKRYALSARLENDANACAVAEWKFGAGVGSKNMVFLTFGTGLGAGLILDGKLYGGANGNAGEVGHIRLARNGPSGFGKEGSFEGFCSGGGIARLAIQVAKKQKQMPACIEKMGGYDNVTTKELAKFAFDGDPFAKKIFAKSGRMLGKGLSIVIDMLNPERIVLGGVFMRSSKLLVPSMNAVMKREALGQSSVVCQIVPAKLSENVGDIAAVSVAALE